VARCKKFPGGAQRDVAQIRDRLKDRGHLKNAGAVLFLPLPDETWMCGRFGGRAGGEKNRRPARF